MGLWTRISAAVQPGRHLNKPGPHMMRREPPWTCWQWSDQHRGFAWRTSYPWCGIGWSDISMRLSVDGSKGMTCGETLRLLCRHVGKAWPVIRSNASGPWRCGLHCWTRTPCTIPSHLATFAGNPPGGCVPTASWVSAVNVVQPERTSYEEGRCNDAGSKFVVPAIQIGESTGRFYQPRQPKTL